MTGPANTFGVAVSDSETKSVAVTDLAVELDPADSGTTLAESNSGATPAESDPSADDSGAAEAVATRLREHGERVCQQELDTALDRLAANGDLTPEERRTLTRLSASITDALVERWVARLHAAEVDEDAALALFSE